MRALTRHTHNPCRCVEETGGLLSEGTRIRIESGGGGGGAVLWHANGKYALFVVECDAADTDLDRRVAALGRPPDPGDASLVSVRWVELRSLLDTRWCQANVHNFARDQLRYLRPTLRQMATKVGGPAAGLQRRPTAPRRPRRCRRAPTPGTGAARASAPHRSWTDRLPTSGRRSSSCAG